ncbi:hypothetical protein ACSDQ9_09760 [Aestuariimicrobium soli]|uniref:hypothetical protein n=1 Tax=Aestuariimicrobium soli TaxID=2035834 RepID=UPI003EBBDFBB
MGLLDRFKRNANEPPEQPRSMILPALTEAQYATFVRLARETLASMGWESTVNSEGVLQLADGRLFGLHNVSVEASSLPESEWPQLLQYHLGNMSALMSPEQPTAADPSTVYLKLRRASDLPDAPLHPAGEPLPGVLSVVALDLPTHVEELYGELDQTGMSLQAAKELGLRNLDNLPDPQLTQVLAAEADPTSEVLLYTSDDFFGASRLLVFPQLFERLPGRWIGKNGVFVIVPNRHLLAVHEPMGRAGTLAALEMLVDLCMREYDQKGSVSPFVYLLMPDGQAHQVTYLDENGQPVVQATGQVGDTLRSVGLVQ